MLCSPYAILHFSSLQILLFYYWQYWSFQAVDPKTPHIKKEIMQNVSLTEGTKQNNGDLIYMKVSILLSIFVYASCRSPIECWCDIIFTGIISCTSHGLCDNSQTSRKAGWGSQPEYSPKVNRQNGARWICEEFSQQKIG